MRVDDNAGSTLGYEPNSYGEWQEQPEFREPPLELDGAAWHWDFREDDDDYYSQPRALFRLMNPEQREALYGNTARAMGDARTLSSSVTSTTACSATPNTGKEWPRPSACSRDNQIWVFRAEVLLEGEASAVFTRLTQPGD